MDQGIVSRYFKFEEKYNARVAKKSILCEVKMEEYDYNEVIYTTKQYLESNPSYEKEICERIWMYAPKTMLLTTVTFAINQYDGSFWREFGRAISLQNHNLWREGFYDALKKENLYVFKGPQNKRYVYNILGHSGIPRSQVEMFVISVILPAIQHGYSAEEVQQIIRSDNRDTSIKTYNLIETVKDFIKIPDSVATDIIERSMEVWREQLKPFVNHYQGYLPDHLLEEFDKINLKSNEKNSVTVKQSEFIRRPVLCYSPEYQNVYISFPKQTLHNSVQQVSWKIANIELSKEIKTLRIPYENNEVEFKVMKKKSHFPILPYKSYNVQLMIDDVVSGEWFFEVSDLMIFNESTYEQVLSTQIIAKQLIIVMTSDHERLLQSDYISYQSIPLLNDWAGYFEVDVTVEKAFAYSANGIRYIFSSSRTDMILVGTKHDVISNLPIYKGSLKIRVGNRAFMLLSTLPNWQLKLVHKFTGRHEKQKLEKSNFKQNAKGHYEMELPDKFHQLLSSYPGQYHLRMYGSLGKDKEMNFYYMNDEMSFNNENGDLIIETAKNYHLNPLNTDVIVLSEWKKKIVYEHPFTNLLFELEMPNSLEKIPVSYFPDIVGIKLMHKDEQLSLGSIMSKALFQFDEAKIMIDLENPVLLKINSTVSVTIFEKLKDGSFYEKQQHLRVGRKHVITLDYFTHQPNSLSKRHIFIRIPALSIDERLLTLETEWHIRDWIIDQNSLNIQLSSCISNMNVKAYHLLSTEMIYEYNLEGLSDSLSIPLDNLADGYYVIAVDDASEDDFNDLFGFTTMPEKVGPHAILLPYNVHVSAASWLLGYEDFTDDGEWDLNQLKLLFDNIEKKQKLYLPILLEDYEACIDFGLANIEQLPTLLQQYQDETLQLFLLVSGAHEWDPISVEKAVEKEFILPNEKTTYVPERFQNYLNYLPAQLNHSYNNTVTKEQCLKGVSLNHEVLQILGRMYIDSTFKDECDDFSNTFGNQLLHLQKSYSANQFVSFYNSELLKRKNGQNFFYTIGAITFFNSLIFYYEHAMEATDLQLIRNATPMAYKLAPKLFLHDVIYWKYQLDQYEDVLSKKKESRKQYEHPSFAWKD